jgi:hypothetical protein
VTHTVTPKPNSDGWNNANVTVKFSAKDDDAGSGLVADSLTKDVVVAAETAGTRVNGSAEDTAGNIGTDFVDVKLDKTAPTIAGSIVAGTLGSNGWYTSQVKVRFTCSDPAAANGAAGSGLPQTACPEDYTFSSNGANQSATRTVTDVAGNVGSVTVSGVSIDANVPTITSTSVKDGAVYTAMPVDPSCVAEDSDPTAVGGTVSGVDSCTVVVTAGAAAGDYSFVATAKDKAGNTSTLSGKYQVNLYKFSGFLQPINDPSIQPGAAMSTVKTGSTLPVKFQLRDAAGKLIQAKSTPQWLTPVRGGATTAPVNETAGTDVATTDGFFRWDAVAQQYIYNWQTKGLIANSTYKIGVRFDDGQTFYVSVGLR